ncbi:MAG: hypothetical protein CVV51_01675 [Spirochaetae bacterium HGW-Spirochaetae-7]|jgi:tetratricopeptide (TPR) repeat protein|nr:MAG: hypothetical protein CVV51_01675 [Spirochaetae bacterium HGW-Spirochaetae-7]
MERDLIIRLSFITFLALVLAMPAAGQAPISRPPSVFEATPLLALPLAGSSDYFTMGGGLALSGMLGFSEGNIRPESGLRFEYDYAPFKADDSLSIVLAEARGGVEVSLSPRLSVATSAGAGYGYGFFNSDGIGEGFPTFSVNLGLSFLLSPAIDLGAEVSYRNHLGLYHGVGLSLGTSMYLSGKPARIARIDAAAPVSAALLAGARADKPGEGLDILKVEMDEVYPVFKSWYDDRALGRVLIQNTEDQPIDGIRLTFYMKQYMDAPKDCPAPASLGPKTSLMVDLTSLFTDAILEVTEGTKANAEIMIEYVKGGETYRSVRNETVRLLDRNAMRWDDDRRAAAFVTAKDPRVLAFSKYVAGLVRDSGSKAVDLNLLVAMGIYKALDLYGLSYVIDPKTPFTEFSKSESAVDYLQFPRQTLEYRGGDCDDLSILYAALLESVGIETAFITVPGHIYLAFALDLPVDEAARSFTTVGDLLIREGRVWIPVEVTERRNGFLVAWQTGAREWREAIASNSAGFFPIHEAWSEYAPVGLPGASADLSMPPGDAITSAFLKESTRFIDREIFPMVTKLEAEVKKSGGSPASRNKLGILYAKYGKMEKAEAEFNAALSKGDFLPALVNLGNLYFLAKDYRKALGPYNRAVKLDAKNARARISLAMVQFELGSYDLGKAGWEQARQIDPALAERYAYLSGSGEAGSRAGAADERKGAVLWVE